MKNKARLTDAAMTLVSKKPAVTTFHNLDWPTVATGKSAKLFTISFPIPGIFAANVVTHNTAARVLVKRGAVVDDIDGFVVDIVADEDAVVDIDGIVFNENFVGMSS